MFIIRKYRVTPMTTMITLLMRMMMAWWIMDLPVSASVVVCILLVFWLFMNFLLISYSRNNGLCWYYGYLFRLFPIFLVFIGFPWSIDHQKLIGSIWLHYTCTTIVQNIQLIFSTTAHTKLDNLRSVEVMIMQLV